uniref:MYCN proto-oncogene, bHLH transcription factor n=1 Tax=Eptatretus burgeri TaxID=7764 RepID=A0A8C4QZZ0_EPTBU
MAYERDLDVMELFLDDDCGLYQSVAPGEDIWKKFGLPLTPPLSPSAPFFPTDSVLDLLDDPPAFQLDNVLSDVVLQDCMWSGFVDRKRLVSGDGVSRGADVGRPRLPADQGVESPSCRASGEPIMRSLDLGEVLGYSAPPLDQDRTSLKAQIKVEELPSPTPGMETPSDSEDDQHEEDTDDDDDDEDDDDDDDDEDEADDEDEEVEIDVVSVEKVPAFALHHLSFGQNTNTAARYGMQRGLGSCAAIKRHQLPVQQQHNYAASPPSPPPAQKASATKRSRIDPLVPTDCLLYGNIAIAPLSTALHCNEDLTKRKTHNILERQRRDSLKRCFTDLRVHVPSVANKERAAKVLILKAATEFTQVLREKENNLEDEKLRLLERRRELVRRLHHLQSV